MARFNLMKNKSVYMGLFVGVSVLILIGLNMSIREGFQNAPVNTAQPVPMESVSTQKKIDFANSVMQMYQNIIIAPPSMPTVTSLPAAPPGAPPPGAPPPPQPPGMATPPGMPPMPPPPMPPPPMPPASISQ